MNKNNQPETGTNQQLPDRYNYAPVLTTDRNNSGFALEQYHGERELIICQCFPASKDFDRLTISKNGPGVWLDIEMDKVKNNRRTAISIQIDKKQALAMIQRLTEMVNTMAD